MATTADLLSAIDHFMEAEKLIVGADKPYAWSDGYSRHERMREVPLGGERGAIGGALDGRRIS